MFKFDFTGDNYREKFAREVTKLVAQEIASFTKKAELIAELTDAYVAQTGERPETKELDELASWLIFGTKGLSLRKRNEVKALKGGADQ